MEENAPAYQAIARRYRPQNFSSVVGQEAIVATLKNALCLKKIAHAYLFCGLRGTGKTTLARLFAKALNCENRDQEAEPCNRCQSCKEITLGKSLDVIEIDGASNRGIDDIREITATIGYAPASASYKIIIIDEVHMLTKEAFNALLKTLEEPPEHVKFLFATTEPHKVLPTIMSRCQRFDLKPLSQDIIKNKLKAIALDLQCEGEEEAFDLIAQKADGSMRDAESLLDQIACCLSGKLTAQAVSEVMGLSDFHLIEKLDAAYEHSVAKSAFLIADELLKEGKDPLLFLSQYAEHLRNLLAHKLGLLFLSSQKETALEIYTEEGILTILDYLAQSSLQLSKTPFKKVQFELILLHIIRSKHTISPATLVKKLFELQTKLKEPPVGVLEAVSLFPKEEKKDTLNIEKAPIVEEAPSFQKPSHFYETLLRFAATELEGSVKK